MKPQVANGLLTNEAVGEIACKVIREVASEAATDALEVARTPVVASPKVGHSMGKFLMAIVDSSSRFHGSPPRTN